jgi:acid phosphatase
MGLVLGAVGILAACGGGNANAGSPSKAPSTPSPAQARHVFLIVMENKSYEAALSGQFTASLAARYGLASNYHAISHPSVPNYLALTSGSTWGVRDDSYYALPKQDLGTQLTNAGVTWKAYMEGLGDAGCLNSPVPYDPGHNPFAYYGGACPSNVVPFTDLATDLAANTPRFSWITPDRCHDTHDCRVAVGDQWLQQTVGDITSSAAWKSNGVLVITWDEDDGSASNHVLTMVLTPGRAHIESANDYDHYSLLATIEDLMGVGRLGQAAHAQPMTDLVR